MLARLPDDWLEEHQGKTRLRPARRKELPRPVRIGPDARESESGFDCHFLPAPFRFCLHCGVSYGFRLHSDFGKLATLSSEGRSTATTILSLTTIRELRRAAGLPPGAQNSSALQTTGKTPACRPATSTISSRSDSFARRFITPR